MPLPKPSRGPLFFFPHLERPGLASPHSDQPCCRRGTWRRREHKEEQDKTSAQGGASQQGQAGQQAQAGATHGQDARTHDNKRGAPQRQPKKKNLSRRSFENEKSEKLWSFFLISCIFLFFCFCTLLPTRRTRTSPSDVNFCTPLIRVSIPTFALSS